MNWKQQVNFLRQQQEREQAWSATQANRQMEFQKEMSSTAHQREVADLQAAGLNPVLSAGGQGAASATGAMATSSSIVPELMSIIKTAFQSHSGGSRVVINNEEPADRPSQYFTPKQMVQGVHAGQGAFHGSAKGLERATEHAENRFYEARRELAESFKDIRFNGGIRGTMRGSIVPTGSANFTGEQALSVVDAYKKFQSVHNELIRLEHWDKAKKNEEFMNNIRRQVKQVLNTNKVDPEARKRLQEIIY